MFLCWHVYCYDKYAIRVTPHSVKHLSVTVACLNDAVYHFLCQGGGHHSFHFHFHFHYLISLSTLCCMLKSVTFSHRVSQIPRKLTFSSFSFLCIVLMLQHSIRSSFLYGFCLLTVWKAISSSVRCSAKVYYSSLQVVWFLDFSIIVDCSWENVNCPIMHQWGFAIWWRLLLVPLII